MRRKVRLCRCKRRESAKRHEMELREAEEFEQLRRKVLEQIIIIGYDIIDYEKESFSRREKHKCGDPGPIPGTVYGY